MTAHAQAIADAVLKAAGSGFQHYMPTTKEEIVRATRAALISNAPPPSITDLLLAQEIVGQYCEYTCKKRTPNSLSPMKELERISAAVIAQAFRTRDDLIEAGSEANLAMGMTFARLTDTAVPDFPGRGELVDMLDKAMALMQAATAKAEGR